MAQATLTPHGEKVETFRLLSGHLIPAVGLGTWKSETPRESVCNALVQVNFFTPSQLKGFGLILLKPLLLFFKFGFGFVKSHHLEHINFLFMIV